MRRMGGLPIEYTHTVKHVLISDGDIYVYGQNDHDDDD